MELILLKGVAKNTTCVQNREEEKIFPKNLADVPKYNRILNQVLVKQQFT